MEVKALVKEIMKSKGYTQAILAEKAGMKRQSNVAEILRGQSLRVDNLLRLLDAMDCELVIRSKTKIAKPGEEGKMYYPEWEVTE